jgi:hypothetical protein
MTPSRCGLDAHELRHPRNGRCIHNVIYPTELGRNYFADRYFVGWFVLRCIRDKSLAAVFAVDQEFLDKYGRYRLQSDKQRIAEAKPVS